MIKNINKNNLLTTNFQALKSWELTNTNTNDLVLVTNRPSDWESNDENWENDVDNWEEELSSDDFDLALEFMDYTQSPAVLNTDCNIALEQQPEDLAVLEEGKYKTGTFFPLQEETNQSTGTFKRLVYSQIHNAFYNTYRSPMKIFGMDNIDFQLGGNNLFLSNDFIAITIPQSIFGERILPYSVQIFDENISDNMVIVDDGNGNLMAKPNLFFKIQEVKYFGNAILSGSVNTC